MSISPVTMRPAKRFPLPRRIRSLGLWLDASATSSLTFNGDTVSEWRDLSGRGRHFSQATAASQPDGANRTYNGLRVIDFDGTKFLQGNAATLNLTRNVSGLTILMVGKLDAQNAVTVARWYHVEVNGNAFARASLFARAVNQSQTIVFRSRRLDNDSANDVPYDANSALLDANVFTGVSAYQAAENRIYVGGVLTDTNVSGTVGRSADTDSRNTFVGGRLDNDVLVEAINGFIGELLIYRRVLSDAERGRLEAYLIAKWNPQPEPAPPPAPAGLSLWQAENLEPVYHWSV